MDDDSPESPTSYCMGDTPGKKKPLTREEHLPSPEEDEEDKEEKEPQKRRYRTPE